MAEKLLNVHQRINAVRETNEYIKKNKRVESYMAVTHDAVTEMLRDDLIKYGVVVIPSVVPGTGKTVPTGTFTKNEVPFIRYEAEFAIAFINVDQPTDREVVTLPAHAIDHGDKAPGKAISYAVKVALLKVFNLVTGEENEEDRPETKGSKGLTEEEFKKWTDTCDMVETAEQATKAWVQIVDACKKAKDERSVTVLRTYLSAVTSKKGIKSGQQRVKTNGGANAGTSTH